MKKTTIFTATLVATLLTGCANVHEFINGDFLNTVSPNTATAAKMLFYPDRYTFDTRNSVPNSFANTAGDHWNGYDFYAFTSQPSNPGQYWANYYKPTKATDNSVIVKTAFFTRYPEKTKTGKYYNSATLDTSYDCSKKTFTYLRGKAYSGNNLDGAIVSDTVFSKKEQVANPIVEGSTENKLFKKVCQQD